MKNCLFVQWKRPTDASRFVIDGQVSEYSGTELQDNVMRLFAGVPNNKEICSRKNRSDLSPSFRCSYKNLGHERSRYFVEGNFDEKDSADRNLVYIFSTLETEGIKVAQILQEYASLLGVTVHAEDLEEIKKHEIKKHTNKSILWIIIILVLLFMLQNLLSK